MPLRACILIAGAVVFIAAGAARAADSSLAERATALIKSNCVSCHGSLRTASLDLRTRATALKGGSHGPVLVPGKPDESRLFRLVSGAEKLQMPPARRLKPDEVALIKQWIAAGAPWPGAETALDDRPWGFRPVANPAVPQVRNPKSEIRNPIDSFVLAKLVNKMITPSPQADRRTLIRRATFDLVGLPPTPDEVDAFVNDHRPDAYERLVDRLLASPHYGERWGRHWLDLVRYAESEGFKSDEMRPNAWRYRDYVIRSLNSDKPYDRFVKEQLAGDELFPDDPDALIATGFCRHWADESNARNLRLRRQEILNDITDTTGSTLLGLTVGCARCHDHKYAPIPQKDYYRLQAFFAAVRPRDDLVLLSPGEQQRRAAKEHTWEEKTATTRAELAVIEEPVRRKLYHGKYSKFPPDIKAAIDTRAEKRTPLQWILFHKAEPQIEVTEGEVGGAIKGDVKKRWDELQKELKAYEPEKPAPLPVCLGITDVGPVAPKTYTLATGVYDKPVEEVQPGFLSAITRNPPNIDCCNETSTGRRSALANWIASPSNPLTARVMVNRLWQYHFGRGLVGTSSDFGAAGERPSHPELLDWLANEFVKSGWSLKRIHRLIMTSAAYRRSADYSASSARVDPEDRLLWRYPRRRLEGEAIRDSMLAVSGLLSDKMGGPGVMAELPAAVTTRGYWKEVADKRDGDRRSIYLFVKRNLRYPLLQVFDFPDTHEPCARRDVTTTAPQALMMLNDELALRCARSFAERVRKEAGSDTRKQIAAAYRLAFDRAPDTDETCSAAHFLEKQASLVAKPQDALIDFCHALLNSNEFIYVE